MLKWMGTIAADCGRDPHDPCSVDPTRLLGFRLEARETVSIDGNGARTAIYRGAKTGVKLGGKPVIKPHDKIGTKLGQKPTTSV